MPTRIPAHQPARMRLYRRDETARPNAHQRGYCDAAHRAWRLAVLTRDAWQCQQPGCGRLCTEKREAHATLAAAFGMDGNAIDAAFTEAAGL
jgi:hypothetical protein